MTIPFGFFEAFWVAVMLYVFGLHVIDRRKQQKRSMTHEQQCSRGAMSADDQLPKK